MKTMLLCIIVALTQAVALYSTESQISLYSFACLVVIDYLVIVMLLGFIQKKRWDHLFEFLSVNILGMVGSVIVLFGLQGYLLVFLALTMVMMQYMQQYLKIF